MKKIFTTLFSIVCFALVTNAQFFSYTAAKTSINASGTYTDLGANGTAITTNFAGGAMTFNDDNSSVQNIGFTFSFSGTDYTQFVLNSNGFIHLGNQPTLMTEALNVLNSTDASATDVIYPFNIDIQSTVNSEFRVYTSGTAPDRVCTIQFKGVQDSGCSGCTPSSTVTQYDVIEFQIKLYETTNIVEFVYGNYTASANPASFIPANVGLKSVDDAHSVNISKASATAWSSAVFLDGTYTGNRFNTRNAVLPSAGYTLKFIPIAILNNNVRMQTAYFLGKVPTKLSNNLQVIVQNIGKTDLTNLPVTLNVTGANTKTAVKTVPILNAGEKATVIFDSVAWLNTGTNQILMSVPADDNIADNVDTIMQQVTALTIGTASDSIITNSIGTTTSGSSIEMATRFRNPIANKITSITTYITAAAKLYRVYVYGVNADTPKGKLYSSATITSVAGKNVLNLASPVTVTGDFYIVVVQLNTAGVNLGCGFRIENPIRPNTFFFRIPQGSSVTPTSAWFDAGTSTLPYTKIMVDATMQLPYPLTLPIKLNSFTGVKEGKVNLLNWQTASEINNAGFNIERSSNGNEFTKIGFENAKGNGNAIVNYSFTDKTPLTGKNYYRLRQVDKDGKEFFSENVVINSQEKGKFEIVKLFPNPTSNNITLVFNSATDQNVNITITNLLGKVVSYQVMNTKAGENKLQLNTSNLAAGNYIVNVAEINTENFITTKFIKQ